MAKFLTDTAVKNAKPKEKPYKLMDRDGLYLFIKKTKKGAGKYWRFDYRFNKKRKTLSIGKYPIITIVVARERLLEARRLLEQGIDPSIHKQMQRSQMESDYANTFEAIALEWYLKFKDTWSDNHSGRIISYLKKDVFPWIGSHPINDINPAEIISIIERVADRGAVDAARRVKGFIQQVFSYAVIKKKLPFNPAKSIELSMVLPPRVKKHYATITDPIKVGELMRSIDDYNGSFIVRCALKLSPLVMLRPKELRQAEWSEIDFDTATWTIPAQRMKNLKHVKQADLESDQHIIPLAKQAVTILQELYPLTGRWKYLFPSARGKSRCMSENAVRVALRTMGYTNDDITPHGFRAMASSMLNEMGKWNPDAIERQLSHKDKNVIRRSYNHAQHLKERREMLQFWADYLDELKQGAEIIPLRANQ